MKKIWLFPNALFQKQTFVFKWIHSRSDLSAPKRLSSMVYKQTSVWPTDMLIISAQNFIKRLGSLLSCMKVDSRGCSRYTLLLKKKKKVKNDHITRRWSEESILGCELYSVSWLPPTAACPSGGSSESGASILVVSLPAPDAWVADRWSREQRRSEVSLSWSR